MTEKIIESNIWWIAMKLLSKKKNQTQNTRHTDFTLVKSLVWPTWVWLWLHMHDFLHHHYYRYDYLTGGGQVSTGNTQGLVTKTSNKRSAYDSPAHTCTAQQSTRITKFCIRIIFSQAQLPFPGFVAILSVCLRECSPNRVKQEWRLTCYSLLGQKDNWLN